MTTPPTTTTPSGRVTSEHLDAYREHGYVFVRDFLAEDELKAARAGAETYFPTSEEFAATPRRFGHLTKGMNVETFPVGHPGLVDVIFHPGLVAAARELLGTDAVLLSQATLMAKYAGTADLDQPHHLDYPNNMLLVPDDGEFNMIIGIVYLTDVTAGLGPTCVVSKQVTGSGLWPPIFTRQERPEWFEAEEAAIVPAGTLLLYNVRTFHRGTAFTSPTGARFTQHTVFQSRENAWSGWRDWPKFGHSEVFYDFIQKAALEQRSILGFPPPGHRYWTPATLAAMADRYPNMDLEPYRGAGAQNAG